MLTFYIAAFNYTQLQWNYFFKIRKVKIVSHLAFFFIPIFFKILIIKNAKALRISYFKFFCAKDYFNFMCYYRLKLLVESITFFNVMGCKVTLAIKGFSNRLFIRQKYFIFRVGLSHLKILTFPLNFRIKLFKRKLLYFFTTQRSYLINFSKRVILVKPRHLYKDVGIRFSREIVQLRLKKNRDRNKRRKKR